MESNSEKTNKNVSAYSSFAVSHLHSDIVRVFQRIDLNQIFMQFIGWIITTSQIALHPGESESKTIAHFNELQNSAVWLLYMSEIVFYIWCEWWLITINHIL